MGARLQTLKAVKEIGAVRRDFDAAVRAHEAGELTDDEFGARINELTERIEAVTKGVRREQ